jgi:ZIP family zinc transporter
MIEWFVGLSPVTQAFLATCFTWFVTALGAASIFVFRTVSRRVLDAMLGFAAGVMIAASFWSLLNPAIELAVSLGMRGWAPAAVGFLSGGFSLFAIDKLLPHLHLDFPRSEAEGVPTTWRRSVLLVLAITLHNIPEGLAVGVAFGAVAAGIPGATLASAVALAIGIGLQNFPEGIAVAAPLRRDGMSAPRAFWYGQASALVEPVAGVVGAALVLSVQGLLPYALAFAAGAMIFVVIEELIPESQLGDHADLATLSALAGFVVMMVLDVALG